MADSVVCGCCRGRDRSHFDTTLPYAREETRRVTCLAHTPACRLRRRLRWISTPR